MTRGSSLAAGRVLVTLGVATQAVPAALLGPAAASTPATSQSSGGGASGGGTSGSSAAGGGTASATSGAAPALTPQEKQWAAQAKARYGIDCVY